MKTINLDLLNAEVKKAVMTAPGNGNFAPHFFVSENLQEEIPEDRREKETYIQGIFHSNIGEDREAVWDVLSKYFENFDYSYCGHNLSVYEKEIKYHCAAYEVIL
jgi:hypothetical protein